MLGVRFQGCGVRRENAGLSLGNIDQKAEVSFSLPVKGMYESVFSRGTEPIRWIYIVH